MSYRKKIWFLVILTYSLGFTIPLVFRINYQVNSTDDINSFFSNIHNMEKNELFYNILKNNFTVIIMNILGSLSFGLLTFSITFFNGFVLGFVINQSLKSYESEIIFSNIAPHSIEIIGILLSCYVGYNLSTYFYNYSVKNKICKSRQIVKENGNYVITSFLIIFIAAILEVYVTIK